MSERIVNDPSLHGWTEENGKWVWDGTDSGAGMIISETEPDAVDGTQWLNSDTAEVFIFDGVAWLEFPGGKDGAAGKDGNIADGSADGIVATWDDTAGQWTPNGAFYIGPQVAVLEKNVIMPQRNGNSISLSGATYDIGLGYPLAYYGMTFGDDNLHISTYHDMNFYNLGRTEPTLKLDLNGDASFSGQVKTSTVVNANNGAGVRLGNANGQLSLRPFDGNVGGVSSTVDLGSGAGPWRTVYAQSFQVWDISGTPNKKIDLQNNGNATFSGTVTVEGNRPVSTKLDIIKTLTTLRNATKDETTLEGLRDSIGNAIGGLIEEFENQIATMPAPEPEVSTMPAGDES